MFPTRAAQTNEGIIHGISDTTISPPTPGGPAPASVSPSVVVENPCHRIGTRIECRAGFLRQEGTGRGGRCCRGGEARKVSLPDASVRGLGQARQLPDLQHETRAD